VGPGWFNIGEPYLDELVSKNYKIFHHEILSSSDDVTAFYERLKSGTDAN
jgi:hypothetical protein